MHYAQYFKNAFKSAAFLLVLLASAQLPSAAAFCLVDYRSSIFYLQTPPISSFTFSKCNDPNFLRRKHIFSQLCAHDNSGHASSAVRVQVPSEENLRSEIIAVLSINPEFGFRRIHQAVKARRPEWAVRDTRIRTLLQQLRADFPLPASPQVSKEPVEPATAYAERLEALYTQHSPTPSEMAVADDPVDENAACREDPTSAIASSAHQNTARGSSDVTRDSLETAGSAQHASLPAGLRAPPQRDVLIDAARAYGDRLAALLELERTHQASEVLERLRAWPTARLLREGLAVTGLVAIPGAIPARHRHSDGAIV